MLDELFVSNLGLISEARIEPGSGLVAVTGETGAGKTLLLGALRLLRGDTARTDRVGPHGDETRVEGRFLLGDTEVVAARRVGGTRSRAYLDGSMVPVKALAERLDGVVEIVAQHEHVALGREASLRNLIDGTLDEAGLASRDVYHRAYLDLVRLEEEAQALGGDQRALARELDLLTHQSREIASARVSVEEDEELAVRLKRLRHAGEIAEALSLAIDALGEERQAVDQLRRGLDAVRDAQKLDDSLSPLVSDLESVIAASEEVLGGLRRAAGDLEHEPHDLAAAEARGAVLGDLKRKYGATIADVLAFGAEADQRARQLETALKRADTISAELAALRNSVLEAGAALGAARRRAAEVLAEEALQHLRSLGFRAPELRFEFETADPTSSGTDKIALAFASDEALRAGSISRVASGGELSRLVLSVRVAAGVADAPVVAFDEVDAGVGGATALAMGRQLSRLARTGQVLVVTHLPQVAAFADRHFVVERSGTSAVVRRVDDADRVRELARMLGGLDASAGGKLHAEELLSLAAEQRYT